MLVSFKNDFSVESFFTFKDKIPFALRSNIVYKYTCDACQASYIGESTRHIKTRIAEHRGLSPRTGYPLTNPSHSSIRTHAETTGHEIKTSNFKIVLSTNSQNLKIAESIIIRKHKPSLNNMDSSVPLNLHC